MQYVFQATDEQQARAVTLRLDRGDVLSGVPILGNRWVCELPADTPNGNGAGVTVTCRDYRLEMHGVLWTERLNPQTGSVGLDVDIVEAFPFKQSLPKLRRRGHCLEQADGRLWTAIQCSDLSLLARFSRGEDIRPVLQQRKECGFNLLRVWTLMHLSQFGIADLDPCPYQLMMPLVDLCAKYGLYIEFTAYTSTFDPEHWRWCNEALRGREGQVLLELVNENDQPANTIDTDKFSPLGHLCSHGSNGSQARPVEPFWDYATFHTNGAFEEQRKVGHNAMEIADIPILTNETSRFPDVGMWPGGTAERMQALAFDSAAGAALLCAGSCFHSVGGKASTLWAGAELVTAKAWADGAHSVPLEVQDGLYLRLDPGEYLRRYQRRIPMSGVSWTVSIRK